MATTRRVTSRPQFTQIPCGVGGNVSLDEGNDGDASAGWVTVVTASEAKSS